VICKSWHKRFRQGDFSFEDGQRQPQEFPDEELQYWLEFSSEVQLETGLATVGPTSHFRPTSRKPGNTFSFFKARN
jgi:hypothetical protein